LTWMSNFFLMMEVSVDIGGRTHTLHTFYRGGTQYFWKSSAPKLIKKRGSKAEVHWIWWPQGFGPGLENCWGWWDPDRQANGSGSEYPVFSVCCSCALNRVHLHKYILFVESVLILAWILCCIIIFIA
jgi:hypothetical protein